MRFEDYIYPSVLQRYKGHRSAPSESHGMIAAFLLLIATAFLVGVLVGYSLADAQEPEQIELVITKAEPDSLPGDDVPAIDPMQAEKEAIAKTVWGEARGCDKQGQANVVWTILNRYDDGRFGDSIIDVVTAKNQFHGYDPDHPIDAEIMEVVDDTVETWLVGEEGPSYLYFTGDGKQNHFREEMIP